MRFTKAELAAQNCALRAELSALRTQYDDLRGRSAHAKADTAVQSTWRLRAAAAREEARRTGRCVKVAA